ncbi:hypothetical protein IAT38_008023 [Cryptococcus sp. DSM 104549]
MILPEDTKAPIHSDDEYDDDFASLPPSPAAGTQAIVLPADGHPYPYDYPSSPTSGITQPLLFPDEDDIELGPAPPYAAVDPRRRNRRALDWKGGLPRKLGRRFIFGLAGGVGVCVGLLLVGFLAFGMRGHPPRHGKGRQDDKSPDDPSGDQRWPDDPRMGRPVSCADFSPAGWTAFPSSEDMPHLPTPLADGEGTRRSRNSTFYVPLHPDEVFAELFMGPAAIGPIFISTYEAESDEVWNGMEEEGVVIGAAPNGKRPKKGEFVRIVVESIVDVSPGADEGDLTIEGSAGWEMMQPAKVCLLQRGSNETMPGGGSLTVEKRDGQGEDKPHRHARRSGLGVGIYTEDVKHSVHGNLTSGTPPLQFRMHIALPARSSAPSTFVDSLLGSLSHHFPRHLVRSLDVHGGNSGIYVDDLEDALIERVALESEYGEIIVDGVRASDVKVKSTGPISARVGVSNDLDVETPIGEINLDISIIQPHPFTRSPPPPPPHNETDTDFPPPPPPFDEDRGPVDPCSLYPVTTHIGAGSGSTTIKFGEWENACRGLNLDVFALLGSVDIHPHPLYQGPFHLITAMGPINLDTSSADIPDPEGLGRWRNITVEARERLGSKFYHGLVEWQLPSSGDAASEEESEEGDHEAEEGEEKELEWETRAVKREAEPEPHPGPPAMPHPWRKTDRAMNVRTSVGAINVTF